jgi:tripartite-type tricarboxylate transporter receptor subunit TctC
MNRQIGAVINSPEVREKLIGLGTAASTGTPEQLAAMLKHDYEITARIIKETGMTVE